MARPLHIISAVICAAALLGAWAKPEGRPSPAGRTFYVDAEKGSDDYDGLSKKRPFRSLDKINSLILDPGDCIKHRVRSPYLRRGQCRRRSLHVCGKS